MRPQLQVQGKQTALRESWRPHTAPRRAVKGWARPPPLTPASLFAGAGSLGTGSLSGHHATRSAQSPHRGALPEQTSRKTFAPAPDSGGDANVQERQRRMRTHRPAPGGTPGGTTGKLEVRGAGTEDAAPEGRPGLRLGCEEKGSFACPSSLREAGWHPAQLAHGGSPTCLVLTWFLYAIT